MAVSPLSAGLGGAPILVAGGGLQQEGLGEACPDRTANLQTGTWRQRTRGDHVGSWG